MIDDAGVPGGRGGVNRLSSGVGVGTGGAFGDLIVSSSVFFSSFGMDDYISRLYPEDELFDQDNILIIRSFPVHI